MQSSEDNRVFRRSNAANAPITVGPRPPFQAQRTVDPKWYQFTISNVLEFMIWLSVILAIGCAWHPYFAVVTAASSIGAFGLGLLAIGSKRVSFGQLWVVDLPLIALTGTVLWALFFARPSYGLAVACVILFHVFPLFALVGVVLGLRRYEALFWIMISSPMALAAAQAIHEYHHCIAMLPPNETSKHERFDPVTHLQRGAHSYGGRYTGFGRECLYNPAYERTIVCLTRFFGYMRPENEKNLN